MFRKSLIAAGVAAMGLALAACTHTPPAAQAADATKPAVVARTNKPCLTTGTRIALKEGECSPSAGRVYGREDLERTGAFDTAEALRRLDPSIGR